jgi:lipopolysaccharide transport system ATP-binding protein
MSDAVIKVENLGKKYVIGHQLEHGYVSLRDVIAGGARRFGNRLLHPFNGSAAASNGKREEFWALKDVSFEVKQGEVIGIIGRNGAGKSTLLKVLSRITEPTTGRVRIRGRVASLLEVGTGFHPELTGRENIFLNGAILGMSKAEIKRKFDEIVAFAEIEKFLDTPVKRYSSGMYVRLAFAVAAHLEPEILLVDEVLAVGDAAFQKKCLKKMGDVAAQDRTILFVSHNITAVQNLCTRVILLDAGLQMADGQADEVVFKYLQSSIQVRQEYVWDDLQIAPGNEQVRLHLARITTLDGTSFNKITVHTPLILEFQYWNLLQSAEQHLTIHIHRIDGTHVLSSFPKSKVYAQGLIRYVCSIPPNLLNDGTYRVSIMIVRDMINPIYIHEDALVFDVNDNQREGWYGKWPGVVRPDLSWTAEYIGQVDTKTCNLNIQ